MSAIELPEEWGMCGCANEGALRLLRDLLAKMNEKGPDPFGGPKKREAFEGWVTAHIREREALAGGAAHWELFMHYIDKMGWSEHGGGINSSWLTGSGEKALELLRSLELGDSA